MPGSLEFARPVGLDRLGHDPQTWRGVLADTGCVVVVHHLGDSSDAVAVDCASEVLSVAEQDRAARFHRDQDRHTFVLGRFLLRKLVAPLTGVRPRDLSLSVNRWGKPRLADDAVQLNLSQSHRAVAVAVSLETELGVDIEHIDRRPVSASLVDHCCSTAEQDRLDPTDQSAFFQLWTLKEATVKALGRGLSIAPTSLEFVVADGEIAFRDRGGAATGRDFFFQLARVFDCYSLAVALTGSAGPVRCEPLYLEYSASSGQLRPGRPAVIASTPARRG